MLGLCGSLGVVFCVFYVSCSVERFYSEMHLYSAKHLSSKNTSASAVCGI